MVEYDVLGNERHKAICKLREMPKLYPGKDGSADVFAWKRELANAIGADTELFSAIRNRLIHLLGGDQPTLSELFGILREDDDGVDARPSDTASADSPVHGSAGCGCGGACDCDGEELLAPITTESSLGVFVREGHDYVWYNAEFLHHHVPTVEDVLREMLDAWGELPSYATDEAIVAEYAAKLKLADAQKGADAE